MNHFLTEMILQVGEHIHQNGKLGKIIHSKSAFWDGDTVDGSEIPGEKTSWGEGSWNPIIYNAYIYVYIYTPAGWEWDLWTINSMLGSSPGEDLTIWPIARCWATRRSVTSDLMSSWEGRGRSNRLGEVVKWSENQPREKKGKIVSPFFLFRWCDFFTDWVPYYINHEILN